MIALSHSRRTTVAGGSLLLVSSLSSLALAQNPPQNPDDEFTIGRTTRHELVSAVGSAPAFGRMVAADLVPDHRPDAAVLQGTSAWVVSGADAHGARLPVVPAGTDVIDIAIWDQGSGPVLVGLTTSASTQAKQLESFALTQTATGDAWIGTVISSVTWSGGTELQLGDLDGDGSIEALVLDGTQVHRAEVSSQGLFDARSPIALPAAASSMRVGSWTSATHDDLLVHDGVHLAALDALGGLVSVHAGSVPISCWTSWWSAADGAGRAAVVRVDPATGVTTMNVIGPAGYNEPAISLGQAQTASIASGDFTGDGLEDVALLNRYDATMFTLFHTGFAGGTTTTFRSDLVSAGATKTFDIAPATSMAGQLGGVAVHDFDSDGDVDCAFGCDATGDVHVLRNPRIDETYQMLDLVYCDADYDTYPPLLSPAGGFYSDYGNYFRMRFASFGSTNYTHIEVVAYQVGQWTGQAPQSGHTPLQVPRAVGAKLLDLSVITVGFQTDTGTELIYFDPITCLTNYYNDGPSSDRARYMVTARLVTYAGSQLVASSPESIFEFEHPRTFGQQWTAADVPVIGNPAPPTPLPDPNEPPPESTPPTPPPASTGG